MYKQPNSSFDSVGRRMSSTNPFRRELANYERPLISRSASSVHLSNSAFEEWVEKNKKLVDLLDDDGELRPPFAAPQRTGSDSDVNYGRYV